MKPETERWLRRSDGHLGSARALFEQGFLEQCVFFCQQALEVLLKAIVVEQSDSGIPPRRTHELVRIATELGLQVPEETFAFLRKLSEQYASTRYGDEPVEYSAEETRTYLEETESLYSWLRHQLS